MNKTWDDDIYLQLMGTLFGVPSDKLAEFAEKDLFDEEYKEKYIRTVEYFDELLNEEHEEKNLNLERQSKKEMTEITS